MFSPIPDSFGRLAALFRNILSNSVDKTVSPKNIWDSLASTIQQICSDDLWTMSRDDFFSAQPGFLFGNKRVGPMRIRQVRISASACSSYYLQSMLSTSEQALARRVISLLTIQGGSPIDVAFIIQVCAGATQPSAQHQP